MGACNHLTISGIVSRVVLHTISSQLTEPVITMIYRLTVALVLCLLTSRGEEFSFSTVRLPRSHAEASCFRFGETAKPTGIVVVVALSSNECPINFTMKGPADIVLIGEKSTTQTTHLPGQIRIFVDKSEYTIKASQIVVLRRNSSSKLVINKLPLQKATIDDSELDGLVSSFVASHPL